MLNAWGMPGLVPPKSRRQGGVETYALLDAAGYTSVVATNSEHDYARYLKLGERIHGSMSLVDVSSEKETGLGTGHFVTTVTEYTTDAGEVVGSMTFRILKFRPGTGRMSAGSGVDTPNSERPTRPEHRVSRDTPTRRESTLRFGDIQVGDHLAPCPIPITPTLIVATAIASRDYQDVHHDRDLAIERGSPDIFMNILTSSGLSSRYVTDWAGPEAILTNLRIRLGVPNYPYDTMTMSGEVTNKSSEGGSDTISLSIRGYNRIGDHLTGTLDLVLPRER
jgi:hypothetical protein